MKGYTEYEDASNVMKICLVLLLKYNADEG